jgi:hypothetical protein
MIENWLLPRHRYIKASQKHLKQLSWVHTGVVALRYTIVNIGRSSALSHESRFSWSVGKCLWKCGSVLLRVCHVFRLQYRYRARASDITSQGRYINLAQYGTLHRRDAGRVRMSCARSARRAYCARLHRAAQHAADVFCSALQHVAR